MRERLSEFSDIDNFEHQFNNRDTYEFYGGEIEVADIIPEDLKDEVPVIIAPGWSETPELFKDSLKVAALKGRRAISFAHPQRGGKVPKQENYPQAEFRKALSLLKVMEVKGLNAADVIAHSEGAINTLIAASIAPEKFRDIVLMSPAGMMGPDKFMELNKRFTKHLFKKSEIKGEPFYVELLRSARLAKGRNTALEYFAANMPNALKEAAAISNADIHKMLTELHKKGIGISVIHGTDDIVFPADKVQEYTKKGEVDGFYSVKGGHSEIFAYPEKYTRLACQALEDLRRKKGKK